ncbi:MAG: radical SAM protein [Thermoplasmata archaeon]|nr:MAG: radical SAM protein [Thermoplasmata archaeon]
MVNNKAKLIDKDSYFEEHIRKIENSMKEPNLQFITWEATKNCDLNCKHCFNPKEDWITSEELKTSEIKRFFWEIAQDFNAREIGISINGGEPTLRNDLVEVIQHLSKLGFSVALTTNGYSLGKDTRKIDELVRAGVKGFAISLDGMKTAHNTQRSTECFDEVVWAIKYIKGKYPQIKFEVATVITKYNFKDLEQMYNFLERLGVTDWKLITAVPIKRAKEDSHMIISDFNFENLLNWLKEKNRLFYSGNKKLHPQFVDEGWCGKEFEGKIRSNLFFCYAGLTIASILYDGKVGVCIEVPRNLSVQGDLRKRDFAKIWKNEFKIFRNKEWLGRNKCVGCSEWSYCRGGAMHNRTSDGRMIQCSFLRLQKIEKKGEKKEILIDSIEEIRTAELFPLVITPRDDGYLVGREEIGAYALFPEIGVETIRMLQYTPSVSKVEHSLRNKYGEDFNVKGFVRKLAKGGFVRSLNEQIIETPKEEKVRSIFNNVSQRKVKWLFSKPAAFLYLFLIGLGLLLLLSNPQYYPSYNDFFITQRYTLLILVMLIFGLTLMFKHELAHLFAARAYGVKSKMRLSNRLMYIVMETDLSNLWLLPKRKRMVAYIAGMMSDLLVISIFVILLYLRDSGGFEDLATNTGASIFLTFDAFIGSSLFYKLAKLIILLSFIMIVFQFMFYMRTDVYYIFAHGLDCKNLYNDSRMMLKNGFKKMFGRPTKPLEKSISDKEMKVVRSYAVLHFVGVALMLLLFLYIFLPFMAALYLGVLYVLSLAIIPGAVVTWSFLDAFIFVSIHVIYLGLLGYFALKKRKMHIFKYVTDKEAEVTDIVMSTVRCPKCKGLFGVEMFSSETQCPHCGVKGALSYGS